jgi:hypothetical protein
VIKHKFSGQHAAHRVDEFLWRHIQADSARRAGLARLKHHLRRSLPEQQDRTALRRCLAQQRERVPFKVAGPLDDGDLRFPARHRCLPLLQLGLNGSYFTLRAAGEHRPEPFRQQRLFRREKNSRHLRLPPFSRAAMSAGLSWYLRHLLRVPPKRR